MSFRCNRCDEEIDDDGIDFAAALPKAYYDPRKKSSISGKLCQPCADEIFKSYQTRSISVRFVRMSGAPDKPKRRRSK